MAASLAIVVLTGLAANALFQKARMPGLLGMLFVGILLGPHVLDLIHLELLLISDDLREIALIVILMRAGFETSRKTIAQVGKTALLMSFIPATLELAGVMLLAPRLLGISLLEAAMLGAILGAVSPAVVVPSMIDLQQRGIGTAKGIPSLLIAASSVDDVFVIVVFTSLLGMYSGSSSSLAWSLVGVPVSIALGCLLGAAIGFGLAWFFRKVHIRDTAKAIVLISLAILLTRVESVLKDRLSISGFLAVIAVGVVLRERYELLVRRISLKLEKVWVGAQILLFVLIGSRVDISVAWEAGLAGLAVILGALLLRCIGVWVSLVGSRLNLKERLFCMLAYIPKATVQAAIGAVPLRSGVASGDIILAVAVLSILITAPLGALGIRFTEPNLVCSEIR